MRRCLRAATSPRLDPEGDGMPTAAAHEKVVRAFFDAFEVSDIEAMVRLMHPDIVWEVPGHSPVAGRFQGLDATGAMMLEIAAMTGGTIRTQLLELFVNDDGVVALVGIDATPPGDDPWHGDD